MKNFKIFEFSIFSSSQFIHTHPVPTNFTLDILTAINQIKMTHLISCDRFSACFSHLAFSYFMTFLFLMKQNLKLFLRFYIFWTFFYIIVEKCSRQHFMMYVCCVDMLYPPYQLHRKHFNFTHPTRRHTKEEIIIVK